MSDVQIKWFWEQFQKCARDIERDPSDLSFSKELDKIVDEICTDLSWEIGPGKTKEWQFVLSPNLNPDLLSVTESIIIKRPEMEKWEFYSARQPKVWDYQFNIEVGKDAMVLIDASNWNYVLLKYPDGAHEIVLEGKDAVGLNEDVRWQVAAVVLESILGEKMLMSIEHFELVEKLENRLLDQARPIQCLAAAFKVGDDGNHSN